MIKSKIQNSFRFSFPALAISVSAIVSILVIIQITKREYNSGYYSAIQYRMNLDSVNQMVGKLASQSLEFKQLIKKIDSITKTELSNVQISLEFEKLNNELLNLDDNLNELKRSLNPDKIEDILLISRMQDRLIQVQQNQKLQFESIIARMENFQSSVIAQTESQKTSVNFLLIVLIPLILNASYTIWKDYKKEKEETESKNNSKLQMEENVGNDK